MSEPSGPPVTEVMAEHYYTGEHYPSGVVSLEGYAYRADPPPTDPHDMLYRDLIEQAAIDPEHWMPLLVNYDPARTLGNVRARREPNGDVIVAGWVSGRLVQFLSGMPAVSLAVQCIGAPGEPPGVGLPAILPADSAHAATHTYWLTHVPGECEDAVRRLGYTECAPVGEPGAIVWLHETDPRLPELSRL